MEEEAGVEAFIVDSKVATARVQCVEEEAVASFMAEVVNFVTSLVEEEVVGVVVGGYSVEVAYCWEEGSAEAAVAALKMIASRCWPR